MYVKREVINTQNLQELYWFPIVLMFFYYCKHQSLYFLLKRPLECLIIVYTFLDLAVTDLTIFNNLTDKISAAFYNTHVNK